MFNEQLPASCASNPSEDLVPGGKSVDPVGGAAAPAGSQSSDRGRVRTPEANRSDQTTDRGNSKPSDHAWAQGKARPVLGHPSVTPEALTGSLPQFPSGRTRDSASPIAPQSGSPMAGVGDALPTPPVSSMPPEQAGGATFSGVPVRAMEDVMACRMRQIVEFGHTPEKDRESALYSQREFGPDGQYSLMRQIARQLSSAAEYAAYGPGKYEVARRNLVKTAAMCLAAIDWIDADVAERDADQDPLPEL